MFGTVGINTAIQHEDGTVEVVNSGSSSSYGSGEHSIELIAGDAKPESYSEGHKFYVELSKKLNSSNRDSFVIDNEIFKLKLGNDTANSLVYNTSGNLKINCTIPRSSENFPNYASVMLKSVSTDNKNVSLTDILLSFITDYDFITRYAYAENLVSSNNVPVIDLKDTLRDTKYCLWGWNAGRKFTVDSCKKMANYYLWKFNDLIDYIITNDLRSVDTNFSTKLLHMFASSDEKLYTHSNCTMVLPSLINWLAIKRGDGKNTALDLCGYVESNSKIFPYDKKAEWGSLVKWSDKDEVITPVVNVPKNINDGLKIRSKYNYPFDSGVQNITMVVETPSTTFDNLHNVTIKFTEDKYPYDKLMTGVEYAKRDKGKVEKVDGFVTEELSDKVTVSINDMKPYMTKSGSGYYTKYTVDTGDCWKKRCPNCWCLSTQTKCWTKHYPDESTEIPMYTFDINNKKFQEYIRNAILTDPHFNERYNVRAYYENNAQPVVTNIVPKWAGGVETGKNYITSADGAKTVYKFIQKSQTLRFANCLEDETRDQPYAESIGAANAQHNITVLPSLTTYVVSYKVSFRTLAKVNEYTGTYKLKVKATKKGNDDTPTYNDQTICMFTTSKKLYFFNNLTFKYWLQVLKLKNNQQYILNELRNYISEHLELVIMNKLNHTFGDYARSLGQSTGFIGIPIGPPLITIPKSYVVDHKNYFPSFTVNNDIDKDHITYNMNKSCNTIINSISCENTKNYLDAVFRAIISTCKNSLISSDTVISIIIPTKGYQLFEVIDKSIVTIASNDRLIVSDKLSDTNSLFYNYETAKILLTMVDLSKDTKYATAVASAYTLITNTCVPVINVTYETENDIKVDINTLTNSEENRCYIYLSSDKTQEFIGALKGVGVDDADKNVDKNKVNNKCLNIQYNGIDSNKTPMCLQLNFL